MSKLSSFLLLIIFLYIFPLYISENVNNSSENISEVLNNTNTSDDEFMFYTNPFQNLDFGNIIWLDDTNATSEIQKHDLLYIAFYSPWCQHCIRLLPEFVKVAKIFDEKKSPLKFAKVDTSVSQNISQEFNLQGVPSFFLIYKGERHFFEGDLTEKGLNKFLNRKMNNDVYKVETLSQVKEYIANSSLVLLSTLKDEKSALYQSFLNFSKVDQKIDFVSCITDECFKEYKEDIILFKTFDEKINKYTEEFGYITNAKPYDVMDFIGKFGIENGGILNTTQINMMFEHKKKMIFYFRNSSLEEQTKYDKLFKELGKEFRNDNIYTCVADIKGEPLHENVAQAFIVIPQDLPLVLYYDLRFNASEENSIYTLRQATNEQLKKEYIKDYLNKINDGKIRKDLYSEPPRDNYIINGLKYVIGRNFDKDVLDEPNNVFLTLIDGNGYYPEADRVLDIMRNLTKKYTTEEKKIVFAYIDATRNQPRGISIKEEVPPMVLLYTNAMPEKKIIRMNHHNFTEITQDEVEDFLYEKLNWGERPHVEKKEEPKKKEEKKEEDKKEEDKKQTDL